MEANDLNKSSQEQVNLESGNIPENKPEENINPTRKTENETSAAGKSPGDQIPSQPQEPDMKAENQEDPAGKPERDESEPSGGKKEEDREPSGSEAEKESPETHEPSKETDPNDSEEVMKDSEPEENAPEKQEPTGSEEQEEPQVAGETTEETDQKDPDEKEEASQEEETQPRKEAAEEQDEQTSAQTEASAEEEKTEEESGTGSVSDSETKKKKERDEQKPPEDVDYSDLSREELLQYYKKLLNEFPASTIKGHVEAIRKEFERKSAAEIAKLREEFLASGEPAEAFTPPHDSLSDAMQDLIQQYRKKREEEREQVEEEKKKNLAAKYEVIEGIKDLVNRQESLQHTFDEFRALQKRWREIGPVPQSEVHDMWENYHLHVENFYNYIKINKELRDLDLKKNYEAKLALCEKAEKLLLEPSVIKAFKTLQKYHDQWRETGPVPRDKKEELWERFREATVKINQQHQEYLEEQKQQLQKNLEAKRELCEKVEAALEKELKTPREWEKTSKAIIEIQQLWKTIGFAPKKENQEIYQRFRKACDAFFDHKRDFFKRYKEEQQNNLQLKNELVQQAEALKDSTDWKNTTEELIRIQKRWKEIGPVPRKHSDAIWKRFRGACDHFFNRKSEFFSKKDETQEENLKQKEALIEELRQYEPGENNEESFRKLQDFQRRWSEIGFVPIKEKDRVNQEFRNLINARFDHLNMDENNKALQKFRNKLENWKSEGQFNERVDQERNKIIGKLKQLENDIILWENNIGFFTKSKNSEALVRDFENKIENGKRNIKLLNQKLDLIEEMENEE
ncbi:MAG: DUF349 domain-containing protein [Marinilabilia sp.]